MTDLRFDRVQETTATTGTGDVSLLGAPTSYQAFGAVLTNGQECYYCITHQTLNQWEVGLGTYNSGPNSLSRTSVLSSSNSGLPVNFGAGTMNVFLTLPAEQALLNTDIIAGSNMTITGSGSTLTFNAAGGSGSPGGTSGQIQYNNLGSFAGFTASGDATINTATGAVSVTKTAGNAFAASATTDTTTTANITDSSNKRFITDAQRTVLGNTSGTNTGDQTNITGNAATVTTINGLIANGTNTTISGSGTSGSPYEIAVASPGTGTLTAVSVASANGFAGSSSGGATPALTLTTSINSPILAGNGTAISAATTTGTGSTAVLSASPVLTGTPALAAATATTPATGDNSTNVATTAFVQAQIAAQVDMKDPVQAATTGALSLSPTYNNGSSGVGATLTATVVGVLIIDGYTPNVGDRLLIKNQAASLQNGSYTLTTAGVAGLTDYVLTRTTDFNQVSNIIYGDTFPVLQGTANANQQFTMNNSGFTTVGAAGSTGNITFVQTSGGSQLSQGTGITITGNSIALTVPVTVALGGTNATVAGATAANNIGALAEANNLSDVQSAATSRANLGAAPVLPATNNFRLTLTSATPVLQADTTAAGTIYLTPYTGTHISTYDSGTWTDHITAELNVALANVVSGKIYDLFLFNNAGTLTIVALTAWTSNTARATAISLQDGVWVNTSTVTDVITGTISVTAKNGRYLGTIYATGTNITAMMFKPAAASGGTANILGLYNASNRVKTRSMSRDNTGSWTYTGTTTRAANNSTSNRITFVDGLQQSFINGLYSCSAGTSALTTLAEIIIALDSTTAGDASATIQTAASTIVPGAINDSFLPQLGLHYIQACEYSSAATATFYGNQNMGLIVEMDM